MHPARDFVESLQRGLPLEDPELRSLATHLAASTVVSAADSIKAFHDSKDRVEFPSVAAPSDQLLRLATDFHSRAGTLTKAVSDAIRAFSTADIRIHFGHQANLFPSAAIMAQFILLDAIAREIQKGHRCTVAQLHVIVDYDVAGDRRFRVAHVPDPSRKGGSLCLTGSVPRAYERKPMWMAPRPAEDKVAEWILEIRRTFRITMHKILENGAREPTPGSIRENLTLVEDVIWDSYFKAHSLAEFNAFFTSKVANVLWGLPVLFLPAHELQACFAEAYSYVIERRFDLTRIEDEARLYLADKGLLDHVQPRSPEGVLPFWTTCGGCGDRVSPQLQPESMSTLEFMCPSCGQRQSQNLTSHLVALSPRIVFDNLLDLVALRVDGGCGYLGQAEHMLVTARVAEELGWRCAPYCLWQAKGIYYGPMECAVGERAGEGRIAWNKAFRYCNEAFQFSSSGRGSFLYQAIACGAKGFYDLWRSHLAGGSQVYDPIDGRSTAPILWPYVAWDPADDGST